MANRVKDILRFVTVWHPENYLRCKVLDLRSKPHHVRPRALSDKRRKNQEEKDGFEVKLQPMDDGIVRIGHGNEVKRYRGTSISGQQLLPFMQGLSRPEPMLIYVPDEVREKAKWKCELRTMADWCIQLQDSYPDGFENLPEKVRLDTNESTIFWRTLRESTLLIRGLWVNPSHNLKLPNNRAINLVLGPIQGHQPRPADLKIFSGNGRCWIEYAEQSS